MLNFPANLEYVVLFGYTLCMVLFLIYSLGQLHLLWVSTKGRITRPTPARLPDELPFVTIQLPVYNERYVVERLLTAVAQMDYPRHRFEIQLLDDSTDETSTIARRCLQQLRQQGIQVFHCRRAERTGFKAGALAHGLTTARGEFVAIFDADFIPQPDFLQRTIGYFSDEQVATVQARWGYLNESASLMTRIEAFMLGLHFGFEQPRRWRADLFLNFNGTGGVWRRAAIEDAGGWSGRTITEDIDLSYRAQLRGWKIFYLNDYYCPGELPEEMGGLRTQQYRWLKGGAENARIHLRSLWKTPLPAHVRWHAAHHLMAGSVYLLILAALFLSVPLAALKNTAITLDYVDYGIPFVTSTIALLIVFRQAQQPLAPGNILLRNARFLVNMILFMIFTMGMSVHNGTAVLSGWLGRRSTFVRTPKNGETRWASSAYVRHQFDPRLLADIGVLLFLLIGIWIGWLRREYAFIPLQLMAATGLVWVIALSFIHPLRASWRSNLAAETMTPEVTVPITRVTLTKEVKP